MFKAFYSCLVPLCVILNTSNTCSTVQIRMLNKASCCVISVVMMCTELVRTLQPVKRGTGIYLEFDAILFYTTQYYFFVA
jgi:hypothetical protein